MKRIDFENGSVTGNILGATLPMLVAQILNLLYNIVDRVYIARIPKVGTAALGDLFQHCAYNQCDGKYADGYSVSGWNVPVWYCTQSDPCSLWTVILAYLLLRISVWWISYASALCISGNVDS